MRMMSSYEFLWVLMSIFVGIALPIRTHSNILEPIRLRILLSLTDTLSLCSCSFVRKHRENERMNANALNLI